MWCSECARVDRQIVGVLLLLEGNQANLIAKRAGSKLSHWQSPSLRVYYPLAVRMTQKMWMRTHHHG